MLFDTDERLIAKALNGHETAWVKLVKRYEKRIYNHCLRMTGATDEAMDIVQEVFISVFRNLPNYRGDGVFPAWIFRIASNRCTDFLRRRNNNPLANSKEGETDNLQSNQIAEQDLHRNQSNRSIMKILACLSLEQRQVVELKLFQNMTFDDIEQHTGLSANTAKTRFYTALKKMKDNPEIAHAI